MRRVAARNQPATSLVAGLPIAVTDLETAVSWLVDEAVPTREPISVRLVNAYSVVAAHQDPAYLRLMQETGRSLPDGTPVALAQRYLDRRPDAGRVRGPSFFVQALERAAPTGQRQFFLGTTRETLDALLTVVGRSWPALADSGSYAPPFGPVTDSFIEDCRAEIVAAGGADCVWVALGTPKQDFVAARLAEALGVPCVAVGAAVDFLAGTKREAPRVLQRLGAEWLYRLATEPRRLWRRYLIGNVLFFRLVLRRPGPTT